MSGEKGVLIFILPEGLQFPVLQHNPATGKVRIDHRHLARVRDANPDVDWSMKGIALVFLMAWYELLREEGFRDTVAEGIRAGIKTPLLKRAYRLQRNPFATRTLH